MRSICSPVLFSLIAATLTGCAAGKMSFTKAGIAPAQQEKDSAKCWQAAQTARQPDDIATANAVGALVGGGIFGLAGTMVASAMTEDDPRNPYRRSAHLDCMKQKGYAATGNFYKRQYTTRPKPEYEADHDDNNGIGMHRMKKKQPDSQTSSAAVSSSTMTVGSVNVAQP